MGVAALGKPGQHAWPTWQQWKTGADSLDMFSEYHGVHVLGMACLLGIIG